MTIASSNGLNCSDSMTPVTRNTSTTQVEPRPDRNTQNGQQPQLRLPGEASTEDMMDAVRTLLLGIGEDPEREGLLKTP
ncbi:MAG: GTP cyclohydrolase I FolE, partial [Coleofasciculus sp. C2-GNP5-27]